MPLTGSRPHRWTTGPAAVALIGAFLAFVAIALLQGEKPFYYDSGSYWSLSETFVRHGDFSFLNFENTGLRGYALPFVYFLVRNAGEVVALNQSVTVMILNSALFALIGAVLAPRLAELVWPERRWGIWRRLCFCLVLLVIWRGFLSYPLSDFPALAAALLALVAVASNRSLLSMAAAGAATALAVEIRPAYLFFVPAILILAIWDWRDWKEHGLGRHLAALGCFLLALAVVALPQSLSQHDEFGSYSPIPGGGELVGLQYTEGLRLQRYDTYVGGGIGQARMTYVDHSTDEIVLGLTDGKVGDTGEYLEIIAEHPLTMGGVFVDHLVNGLDDRYPTPYVEDLQTSANRPLRAAGFLIVFLALLRLLWPLSRRRLAPTRWRYVVALLCGSASSVASAVETRFMLPVFVVCTIMVLAPGWPPLVDPARVGPRRYLPLAAIALAAVAFFVAVGLITEATTDSLVLTSG